MLVLSRFHLPLLQSFFSKGVRTIVGVIKKMIYVAYKFSDNTLHLPCGSCSSSMNPSKFGIGMELPTWENAFSSDYVP
jgi:hypothetical protein